MDYETFCEILKRDYNDLIGKKRSEIIHKKEKISKEVTLIEALFNNGLDLSTVKDVLVRNNIDIENAYKFIELFEKSNIDIKNPSVKYQYNNFLNLVKPALDERKKFFEEEYKILAKEETEIVVYTNMTPSVENLNLVDDSAMFTEEEKLLIVKYLAYESVVKQKEVTKLIPLEEPKEIGSIEIVKEEFNTYESYVQLILKKRETSNFDSYYDALMSLTDEDSFLLGLKADKLNDIYNTILYSYENLINAINDDDYPRSELELKKLKNGLSKYGNAFEEFKKGYIEFKKTHGNLLEKTDNQSYAIEIESLEDDRHAIEIEKPKKVTKIKNVEEVETLHEPVKGGRK